MSLLAPADVPARWHCNRERKHYAQNRHNQARRKVPRLITERRSIAVEVNFRRK